MRMTTQASMMMAMVAAAVASGGNISPAYFTTSGFGGGCPPADYGQSRLCQRNRAKNKRRAMRQKG